MNPGAEVAVSLKGSVEDPATGALLIVALPHGWTVSDVGGGTLDPSAGSVSWDRGDLDAGATLSATMKVTAPTLAPGGEPASEASFEARLDHAGGTAATATATVLVAPGLIVEHYAFARIAMAGDAPVYLGSDANLGGVQRYDVFRVRFQIRNADTIPVAVVPGLQYRRSGGQYADLPVGDREIDVPFFIGQEWRGASGSRGTELGPESESIAVAELREVDRDDPGQQPSPGVRLMGTQHRPAVELAGETCTEVEFTVKVTNDVLAAQDYEFRLVDAGQVIPDASVARARSADKPTAPLSPGQRNGVPVGPPKDADASVGGADVPLDTASTTASWPESNGAPMYRLALAVPTAPANRYQLAAPFLSPHSPDTSMVSDTCAICHRAHAADGPTLLAQPAPEATMCLTCHDGTGSSFDVRAQYDPPSPKPSIPPDDPGNPGTAPSAYYRHDALNASASIRHTLSTDDEFGGVLNRHSECADCHNSHNATATAPTQWTDGWSVSGRQATTSGVAVANGDPGEAPTYTWLNGTAGSQPDREYQICFKCHSGFTKLPKVDAAFPSTWELDKGVELNPGNASYHPVEAAGKNGTDQMKWSLANSSPYKQWNFAVDGTVRCVNCHGDPAQWDAKLPPNGADATTAGADLAPHASQYRGLLIQNYRDRELKAPDEPYAPADFALCLVCHAEASFTGSTKVNTAFREHDNHLWASMGEGPGGTDIDTPGQGGGNAICAECHFRTHSTAQAYNAGDRSNPGLVNFSPNVEPCTTEKCGAQYDGVLQFTGTATGGTCTLVCHGRPHKASTYSSN